MPPPHTVIVADAHLGYAASDVTDRFHRFLEAVPTLGSHLLINGDLFEFWFEYRSAIPTACFPTLERLATLCRGGTALTIVGGNHDRWGGRFWETQLGARFYPRAAEIDLAGHRAFVAHGDGLSETRLGARVFHAVVGHPLTVGAFRLLHPDAGLALVRRLSPRLAGKDRTHAQLERAADRQSAYAHDLLSKRRDIALVVLAHTHVPVIDEVAERRWHLNPGAWQDGGCYAVMRDDGPRLYRFED